MFCLIEVIQSVQNNELPREVKIAVHCANTMNMGEGMNEKKKGGGGNINDFLLVISGTRSIHGIEAPSIVYLVNSHQFRQLMHKLCFLLLGFFQKKKKLHHSAICMHLYTKTQRSWKIRVKAP
jgi:hypothetical protein